MGMKSYPLAMPPELLDQVARTATDTGLSMADAMRQSIKLGLPKLREQLSGHSLEPFTKEEARRALGQILSSTTWSSIALDCPSGRQRNGSLGNLELPAGGLAGASSGCDYFAPASRRQQTGCECSSLHFQTTRPLAGGQRSDVGHSGRTRLA